VPDAAGGGTDALARMQAERIGPKLGQNVLVQYETGAGGILGIDAVGKSTRAGRAHRRRAAAARLTAPRIRPKRHAPRPRFGRMADARVHRGSEEWPALSVPAGG